MPPVSHSVATFAVATLVALCCLTSLSTAALAETVDGADGQAPRSPRGDGVSQVARKARLDREPDQRVVLGPIDPARLGRAEPRGQSRTRSLRQIGVVRDFSPVRLRVGDDGVRSVLVESGRARAVRVRLRTLEIGPGAEIFVRNADDPAESYGPLRAPAGSATWYTPTVFGNRAVVEVRGADVRVDGVVHTYRLERDGGDRTEHERTGLRSHREDPTECIRPVACEPEWAADAGRAVAVYGFIRRGRIQLFCTGTLLNDVDETTEIPWFLTANHCISTQKEAASLEVFWDYRSSTCNGEVPKLKSVPRTSGARLAATSAATDVTLLELTGQLPANRFFAGWSSDPVAPGTAVAGVQHPDTQDMRIAFGEIDGPAALDDGFHRVLWSVGVTAPGSSGSAIFTQDRRVVGQLLGGLSFCDGGAGGVTAQTFPDEYGKLERSFPILAPFLARAPSAPIPQELLGAPRPPLKLRAKVRRSTVRLKWKDKSKRETGWRVERLVSGVWTPVATLPADTRRFDFEPPADAGAELYRVGATNADGTTWEEVAVRLSHPDRGYLDVADPADDDPPGATDLGGELSFRAPPAIVSRDDPSDWYSVDLVAGRTYLFSGIVDRGFVGVDLFGSPPSGAPLASTDVGALDDFGVDFVFVATRSGPHFVRCSTFSRKARWYQLQWESFAPAQR